MPVKGVPASVVAASHAGVSVPGGVLYVLQGDARLPGAGDERNPERVRPDLGGAVERGPAGEPADHLPGLGLAHPRPGAGSKQRPGGAAAQVVIEGAETGTVRTARSL